MTTAEIPVCLKWTMKALRIRLGISQNEASRKLGISVPTLKKWEDDSSTMNVQDVNKVTKFYHIPQEYIFFGNNFDLIEELEKEESK